MINHRPRYVTANIAELAAWLSVVVIAACVLAWATPL